MGFSICEIVQELENQVDWVTISIENGVHKDEVIKVEYFSDNNTIVSCSNDPATTLIIRYLAGRRAPYIFKLTRVRYLETFSKHLGLM